MATVPTTGFRAAWVFAGTALGGRNELYERFHLGSAARSYQLEHGYFAVPRPLTMRGGAPEP